MQREVPIGDSQTNWIETVVSGAGQIGFWWKANGEYEVSKKGVITRYDYAEFTIDGAPVEEIGDESDWTYVTIPVEGSGSHVLRWMYHKDESGSDGDDCAWLSEVSWEPTQVAEPIPELPENPTAEDVQSALVGSADGNLRERTLLVYIRTRSNIRRPCTASRCRRRCRGRPPDRRACRRPSRASPSRHPTRGRTASARPTPCSPSCSP